MGDGAGLGGGALELGDVRAEDETLGEADALDGFHDLLTDEGELAAEVEHGDGSGGKRLWHRIMLQVPFLWIWEDQARAGMRG